MKELRKDLERLFGLLLLFIVFAPAQEFRQLNAKFYDHSVNSPDFGGQDQCKAGGGDRYITNMVQPELYVAPDGKKWPLKGPNADLCDASGIESWFDERKYPPICKNLTFQNVGNADRPQWRFYTTPGNGRCRPNDEWGQCFFPLDDIPGADIRTGAGGKAHDGQPHNYDWTMQINASFTYRGDERFQFNGDDDLWVFINNRLAFDLGGVHSPRKDSTLILREKASELGLTVGGAYDLDIYFAERKGASSTFNATTTIDIKPRALDDIALVDKSGLPIGGSIQISGPTEICGIPQWTSGGRGACTNYGEAPPVPATIPLDWSVDNVPDATQQECFVLDPTGRKGGDQFQVTGSSSGTTSRPLVVTVLGVPQLNQLVLEGNGRLEGVTIEGGSIPNPVPPGFFVNFEHNGVTYAIDPASPLTGTGNNRSWSVPAEQLTPLGPGSSQLTATQGSGALPIAGIGGEVPLPLVDRMTPAIHQAQFLRAKSAAEPSRLVMDLSELLGSSPGVAGLQKEDLQFKSGQGVPFQPDLSNAALVQIAPLQYELHFNALATRLPQQGDSVSLGSGVQDAKGNQAVTRFTEIAGDAIAPLTVLAAALYDTDGDGRIETARLFFDNPLLFVPQNITLANAVPGTATAILPPHTMALLSGGQGLEIRLDPNSNPFPAGQTDISLDQPPSVLLTPQAALGLVTEVQATLVDSAGPVLLAANSAVDATTLDGTLTLLFSEPINPPDPTQFPYEVTRSDTIVDGNKFVPLTANESNRAEFEYSFQPTSNYPVAGDSIRIVPGSPLVADATPQTNLSQMCCKVLVEGNVPKIEAEITSIQFEENPKSGAFFVARKVLSPIAVLTTENVPVRSDGESQAIVQSNGPTLRIRTAHPIERFDFLFYDNLGNFVNRAEGSISTSEWDQLRATSSGSDTTTVRFMWYPVSEGNAVGSGAYIVKGSITTRAGEVESGRGIRYDLTPTTKAIDPPILFGYLRNQ